MAAEHPHDTIQASRKFFGYALSHSPLELFEGANRPTPTSLGVQVTDYVAEKALDDNIVDTHAIRRVSLLFAAAIKDTQTIITQEMHDRNLSPESLPLIARDIRTITSIARIAMHSEGYMRTILSPGANRRRYFTLSDDASHIQVTPNLVEASAGGCPFASTPDRIVRPDPIFRQTIGLAGDLSYLAHKNKRT